MAVKENNGAQNIDGVLEQLKQSYSADNTSSADTVVQNERASRDVSGDELQAMLRSQFLGDDAQSFEAEDSDYQIDEDFFIEAEDDFEDVLNDYESDKKEESEENVYELNQEFGKGDEEVSPQEENAENGQEYKEEPVDKNYQALQEEDLSEEDKEFEEIGVYKGYEALQEEEYIEAFEENYAPKKAEKIQESDSEGVQINLPEDFSPIESDDLLWSVEEKYEPILTEDVDEFGEDSSTFERIEDTRTESEKSEDNYVGVFYRSNERDPYENMSFKERIADNAPTVDTLEAELFVDMGDDDFTLEEFAEAESIPLILDDDDAATLQKPETMSEAQVGASSIEELDRSDLALLLEFGYADEVLRNVSDKKMESISDDEFMADVIEESKNEPFYPDDADTVAEPSVETTEERSQRLVKKLAVQHKVYRQKRTGALLRLIITAVVALCLLAYELIPILNSNLGGLFNREDYFFAYVLVGLQILIIAALPAIKIIYESFKGIVTVGINAYFISGVSLVITVLYDFIVVFERKDVPPTFHFCAALVLILAELTELMGIVAEIRNYEYYFGEYLFEDEISDAQRVKYTLEKSEGEGSIADRMYRGGLDTRTVVCSPQEVDSASGFFDASRIESTRNRKTFSWIVASLVAGIIFTIISGRIYEEIWIAAATFLITFNFMMPVIAMVAEWLPFERISAQRYSYGSAFASEGSAEVLDECDMLIFNDFHIFEKCENKNVNLAIYDSTSKAVLLSCLNAIYSEIGGPLKEAFSKVKVQSLGKCKINRVAKSGVEAIVGSSYSVLLGDEQFMSRYGIYFPKAELAKEEDKIFTLCVSINNRATARIAVRYKINETFYNVLQKLLEDKIYCVVQTYDPMVSSELIARVRPFKGAPVSVVHKSAADYELELHKHKSGALYSVMRDELIVMARGSRLNLAIALSNAKKLCHLRKILNLLSGILICSGGISALMLVLSENISVVNWLFVLIYWFISGAVMAGLMLWKFPQRDRFIFNKNNRISRKKKSK